MSIKYGLVETKNEFTDGAGVLTLIKDTTKTDEQVSLVFNFNNSYYTLSDKLNDGAKYPLPHDLQALNRKDYVYSLAVYDSVTKLLVDSSELTYEVLYNNLLKSNYTTNKNNSLFNIVFSDLPKQDISLTVRVRGDNYLTTYAQITSTGLTTYHTHNIGIVNINNVPDGVSIVNTILEQNNNGTIQEYILNFPSSLTKYESSTITVPQGTKFYDTNHNLLEGPINVKIGHFSPTTAAGLFSPGWNVSSLKYNDKIYHNVGFVSGGFYSVEISDASGRIAKTIF